MHNTVVFWAGQIAFSQAFYVTGVAVLYYSKHSSMSNYDWNCFHLFVRLL